MVSWSGFVRGAVLTVAENRAVSTWFRKHGMRMGVSRFVAAERLEQTLDVVSRLNSQGLLVTLDYLGESVNEPGLAEEAADQAIAILRDIREKGVNSNISVKLTQLGLCIDRELCLEQMRRILDEAVRTDNFVRIDMEDSSVTSQTIDVFTDLLEQYGPKRVGLVLQSYLYRSRRDRARLGKLGANLRIVKGAYNEPKRAAFPDKADVDANYKRLVEDHLRQGCYTAIATHDEKLINHAISVVNRHRIPKNQFEFQMLFGIAASLQLQLAERGYKVRVYTPFGEQWYPYFTRRMAERPANVMFVLKGLFRK